LGLLVGSDLSRGGDFFDRFEHQSYWGWTE